ncbi:MAG TPA: hypothetical protein VHM92_02845 [Allosphingosinicella sp.]|nr:hypothetical protein [Allosphingosinicella sp.]
MYTMYGTPPDHRFPGDQGRDGEAARLRECAMRLAAELDEAGLYRAAAYAGMAADATEDGPRQPSERELRTDVETYFELDEHGRVWMIREGDCHIIGREGAVCAGMRRFLVGAMLGKWG